MRKLFDFFLMTITRVKNRLLILLYNKPESIFMFFLLIIGAISVLTLTSSIFKIKLDMSIGLFPTTSYILFMGGLLPYILFAIKSKSTDDVEDSLLYFISKDFFHHFKKFFSYLIPFFLSVTIHFMILSIYQNISLMYSIIFWQILTQIIFIVAIVMKHLIQKLVGNYITPNYSTLVKHGTFLGFIAIELSLPVHNQIGRLWLEKQIPILVLIFAMVLLCFLTIYISSLQIEYKNVLLFNSKRFNLFRNMNFNYGFLVLIHIKDYLIFNILTILFLAVISKLSHNYDSVIEIFVLFFILGSTTFIFSNLDKYSPGIEILRISHLKYSSYLLHIFFSTGIISMLLFLKILAMLHELDFMFLLENMKFISMSIIFYFSLYFSIVTYYLFHKFFDTLAQGIASMFILLISYIIVPEFINRVQSIDAVPTQTIIFVLTTSILFLIMTLTIDGYENDTTVN